MNEWAILSQAPIGEGAETRDSLPKTTKLWSRQWDSPTLQEIGEGCNQDVGGSSPPWVVYFLILKNKHIFLYNPPL